MAGSPKPRRLYLIDGSGYIFRAFYAIRGPMTRPDGTPVNAVYGFSSMMMKLLDDLRDQSVDELIAVVFDTARKTFRNEIYKEYKAHRPPPPDDLVPQFAIVREATRAFNVPILEMAGYEADDLIATYAKLAEKEGIDVVIISGDKDLMQLIRPGVRLRDPMKNTDVGLEQVMEKFGVPPNKVVDVQALMGDSTDNVPGVPGIGQKTAAELINTFGDLDTLLKRAGEIKQNKRRESLQANVELAKISRELVTLKDDCPVDIPLENLMWHPPDEDTLVKFLSENAFKSLVAKVNAKLGANAAVSTKPDAPVRGEATAEAIEAVALAGIDTSKYETVQTRERLKAWADKALKNGWIAVDTETNGLDPRQAKLVGISLCVTPGEACYIPLEHGGHADGELALDAVLRPNQLTIKDVQEIIGPMLRDPAVMKVGHNIKYDMHILSRAGFEVTPIDDTIVISYVLDGAKNGHGMDELSELHLGHKTIKFTDVCGTGKNQITFDKVPLEKATAYAAEDADVTRRFHTTLKPRLARERLTTVYETLERPLIPILHDMETKGILVDTKRLKGLSDDFAKRMVELERDIHKLAGEEFNVGSPKQLGEILFERMSLPGGKKGKTGAYGTGADVLEELAAQGHDLPAHVLEWRQLAKLKSTYTDALVQAVHPETKRVHTCFSQTIASTGRLSSTEPNLQNIPIRTEEGRKIRTAFVAPKGKTLISADYSQIELRLVAHVADIKGMKEAFKNGEDIHAATASQMFGVPMKDMTPELRRRAKAINFGIIYGISAFGLARNLGIERSEAQAFITAYFNKFPEIQDYMNRAKEEAKANGFVMTPFGRRCWVPGIGDKNGAVRSFAERQAINAPIQGGAADIIKRAMIRLPDALKKANLKADMLLQVHDELIFEVPDAEVDATKKVVKTVMEGAAQLSVPLLVETGSGANWDEAH
jgi:DNA polymerase-1